VVDRVLNGLGTGIDVAPVVRQRKPAAQPRPSIRKPLLALVGRIDAQRPRPRQFRENVLGRDVDIVEKLPHLEAGEAFDKALVLLPARSGHDDDLGPAVAAEVRLDALRGIVAVDMADEGADSLHIEARDVRHREWQVVALYGVQKPWSWN